LVLLLLLLVPQASLIAITLKAVLLQTRLLALLCQQGDTANALVQIGFALRQRRLAFRMALLEQLVCHLASFDLLVQ
jgi:hypothetical protein